MTKCSLRSRYVYNYVIYYMYIFIYGQAVCKNNNKVNKSNFQKSQLKLLVNIDHNLEN